MGAFVNQKVSKISKEEKAVDSNPMEVTTIFDEPSGGKLTVGLCDERRSIFASYVNPGREDEDLISERVQIRIEDFFKGMRAITMYILSDDGMLRLLRQTELIPVFDFGPEGPKHLQITLGCQYKKIAFYFPKASVTLACRKAPAGEACGTVCPLLRLVAFYALAQQEQMELTKSYAAKAGI